MHGTSQHIEWNASSQGWGMGAILCKPKIKNGQGSTVIVSGYICTITLKRGQGHKHLKVYWSCNLHVMTERIK